MNTHNYGFSFNDITIINNLFSKKGKNDHGKQKINDEIEFYKFVENNNIDFPMPTLYTYEDGKLEIQYINNAQIITNMITPQNYVCYINNIKLLLNKIHDFKLPITSEILKSDIMIETETKIIKRYNEYNWESNKKFKNLQYVNGLKFKSINYYSEIIKYKCLNYLNNRNYYNLIHGDTHLGNIMESDDKLYFIDPRGKFGNTNLFGIKEYDYAKLLFGISGYSKFDEMEISELKIENGDLKIDFIKEYEYIFSSNNFDNLTKLLSLSIWLGNNSCFIDENKKIFSLMIAFYYCEKYLDKF